MREGGASRVATAAGIALLLAGCAMRMPLPVHVQLAFVNHSGRPVTVELLGQTEDSAAPGVAGKYLSFRLISDACVYLYSLPVASLLDAGAKGTLQVEADFRLYATETAAAVPVEKLARKQPSGFPLVPVDTQCKAEPPDNGVS